MSSENKNLVFVRKFKFDNIAPVFNLEVENKIRLGKVWGTGTDTPNFNAKSKIQNLKSDVRTTMDS